MKIIIGRLKSIFTKKTRFDKEFNILKVNTDEKLTNEFCQTNKLLTYSFLNSTKTLYDFSNQAKDLKIGYCYLFTYENETDDFSKSEDWWKLVSWQKYDRQNKEIAKEQQTKNLGCKVCQNPTNSVVWKKNLHKKYCSLKCLKHFRKTQKQQKILLSQQKYLSRQEQLTKNSDYQKWVTPLTSDKRQWDVQNKILYVCQYCGQDHSVSYDDVNYRPSKISFMIDNNYCFSYLGSGCQNQRFLNQPLCYQHLINPKNICLNFSKNEENLNDEMLDSEQRAIQLIRKARQNRWDNNFDDYQVGKIGKKILCKDLSFQKLKERDDKWENKDIVKEINDWLKIENQRIKNGGQT